MLIFHTHIFGQSYATLSATTQFTSFAQNVHHRPKRTLGGRTIWHNFVTD